MRPASTLSSEQKSKTAFADVELTPERSDFIAEAISHSLRGTPKIHLAYLAIGVALVAVIIIVTGITGNLLPSGHPAVAALFERGTLSRALATHLMTDPLGLVIMVTCVVTPVMFALQLESIRSYLGMNRRNAWLITTNETREMVVEFVDRANRRFARLGSRRVSLLVLMAAVGLTAMSLWYLDQAGVYKSQIIDLVFPRLAPHFGHLSYATWWAGWQNDEAGTVTLGLLGVFMIYSLIKQLGVGLVFTMFAVQAHRSGFTPSPYPLFNIDGHNGLRELRAFILRTYISTSFHLVAYFAVFVVAVPLDLTTMVLAVIVTLTPVPVVYVPTWLARKGIRLSADRWVCLLLDQIASANAAHGNAPNGHDELSTSRYADSPSDAVMRVNRAVSSNSSRLLFSAGVHAEAAAFSDALWTRSNVPIRLRGVLSGMFLQLLVPLAAVLIPVLLHQ